jgi:hypothetical protein
MIGVTYSKSKIEHHIGARETKVDLESVKVTWFPFPTASTIGGEVVSLSRPRSGK